MNTSAREELNKEIDEAGSISVSAGARVHHVQLSLQRGQTVQVDLVGVPHDKRLALIREIVELVNRARSDSNDGAVREPSMQAAAKQAG